MLLWADNGTSIERLVYIENAEKIAAISSSLPRIPGISMRAVPLKGKRFVIVIRIPKSWASPHMITKGSSKFYSRNSAGKYPLDVFEIRTAFNVSLGPPPRG